MTVGIARRTLAAISVFAMGAGVVLVTASRAGAADPPTLAGVHVVGSSPVDVSGGATSVAVDIRYNGGDAGLSAASVILSCETGCGPGTSSVSGSTGGSAGLVAGDISEGVVAVTVQVPQTAAAGDWAVSTVALTGSDGSQSSYGDSDLAAYDSTRDVTVTKTADTTSPSVHAISFPFGNPN
ncbi:MAG TPA: hypothetical protein VMH41_05720, partial [Mycobacteriales bacterium]|nr:hypothetical protein [Mycobacteriales bacterium]